MPALDACGHGAQRDGAHPSLEELVLNAPKHDKPLLKEQVLKKQEHMHGRLEDLVLEDQVLGSASAGSCARSLCSSRSCLAGSCTRSP